MWEQSTELNEPTELDAAGNLVVAVEGDGVVVRDRRDGHPLWRYDLSRRYGERQLALGVRFVGSRVFIAGIDRIESLDFVRERVCWSASIGQNDEPYVFGHQVLVGYFKTGKWAALNAATGHHLWSLTLPGGSPVDQSGDVDLFRADVGVVAINARTGRRLWSEPIGTLSDVVAIDGGVAGVSSTPDGRSAHLIDVDRFGRLKWSVAVGAAGNNVPYSVFRYRNEIVCTDEFKVTRAFTTASGSLRWTYALPGSVDPMPPKLYHF